jgi:MFS family permease
MKPLTIVAMLMSTVMVIVLGYTPVDLQRWQLTAAACGFFTNAAIIGMYAIFAQVFPTHIRAFGTGFAIGVGRGGSALAPALAGALFKAGWSLPTVATTMSVAALIAAGVLSLLKLKPDQTDAEGATSQTRIGGAATAA